MENWGLITYRESVLFHDPVTSSNLEKEFTAIVIAHELRYSFYKIEVLI